MVVWWHWIIFHGLCGQKDLIFRCHLHRRHTMVDSAEFWINCQWPSFFNCFSEVQLIQKSAASTIVWRQCDIRFFEEFYHKTITVYVGELLEETSMTNTKVASNYFISSLTYTLFCSVNILLLGKVLTYWKFLFSDNILLFFSLAKHFLSLKITLIFKLHYTFFLPTWSTYSVFDNA